ncbi:hypothetical protein SUGI_0188660 [Cryptomeria japonica]|uniref:homeobox-leucine zipper protein ROC7 n=1 Tax=Cryptomeria japonica TaxID=3369 RepID=UPI002408E5BE|nr:homeobox-leucine zipper protein ROC7 [Cryptomeria japonica]GLJ12320.1 hypothetical protein SUGI_0188660 [Cryptomeria japonica]
MSDNCEGDRNNCGDDYGGASSTGRKHLGKRHTRYNSSQVEIMEEFFKVCQHPDEKERLELSNRLGLTPQQIKFWFQNRRTQVKVQQDRTVNAFLHTENERLRMDILALQRTLQDIKCLTCGGPDLMKEMVLNQQKLAIQNQYLKVEVAKLSAVASNRIGRTIPLLETRAEQSQLMYSSHHGAGSSGQNQITLPTATCVSMDESSAMQAAEKATEEFIWMFQANEPIWVKKHSVDGTIEILNPDELCRSFPQGMGLSSNMKREGSRDTSIVSMTGATLVDIFMDVNKWKEMFSLIVTRAETVQVLSQGVGGHRNGLLQEMYAQLQILSPLVPTRHISFFRFSQQLGNGLWAVVDFSASVGWYHKHPSGCVIQDMPNGCSKVTWIEQAERYEQVINSEMAFGAQHWLTCLQRQCDRFKALVDFTSQGVGTVLERNMIRLAQSMGSQFVANISALSQSSNDPIKIITRRASEVGQSSGAVVCFGASIKLSISPKALFDFLCDEKIRSQNNILSCGVWEKLRNFGSGSENSISLFDVHTGGKTEKMLKQSYRDAPGSFCVYAAIDVDALNSRDASSLHIASHHGFAVLPYHTTPAGNSLIPTSIFHKAASATSPYSGSSVLTVNIQEFETQMSNCSPSAEYVQRLHGIINNTIQRIKDYFGCVDD